MKTYCSALLTVLTLSLAASVSAQQSPSPLPAFTMIPADKATNVNPDAHLVLAFSTPVALGTSAKIRIYDAADNRLVDTLDMSIPPGPTGGGARGAGPAATYTPTPYEYKPGHFTNANTVPGTPSGVANPTPNNYQLTIIGGFTDGFHFYPVILNDDVATIYPHNNLLDYNKTYYVQVDPEVFTVPGVGFKGISGTTGWTFSTKKAPPPANATRLVVAGDGSGDFNTVQGAMDFIPDKNPNRVTVFIKNGTYEEIVYFRNKTNVTLLGESRDRVVVGYANNEVLNPHPSNVLTNEWPGTFPSRRAAFMSDNSSGINLVNFSIQNFTSGQAEGILMMGGKNIISNMNIVGSGDAIQLNDSVYVVDSDLTGAGDSILTRGPGFYYNSTIHSGGACMWIRNTDANHGCVFVNCTIEPTREPGPTIARAPTNGGRSYTNAEVVLINCVLGNLDPALWGPLGGDTSNMHFWEYNSTNLSHGKPADVSGRNPASRQLTMPADAKIITDYSNPPFVLGGWTPAMAPVILSQPESVSVNSGKPAILSVKAAAVPAATYQWKLNGTAIKDGSGVSGATTPTLTFNNAQAANAGKYTVVVTNASGTVTSTAVALSIDAIGK